RPWPEGSEEIILAGGCFWGIERIAWQIPGVHTTSSGYAGGYTPHPTYEEVFSARTGHAEAVRVIYTGGERTLRALLTQFWEQHDPTTAMRQGNDVGTEYRSAVYWTSGAQGEVVRASAQRYQQALDEAGRGTISTELLPLAEAGDGVYYTAEAEHQQFLERNPSGDCTHGFNGVACSLCRCRRRVESSDAAPTGPLSARRARPRAARRRGRRPSGCAARRFRARPPGAPVPGSLPSAAPRSRPPRAASGLRPSACRRRARRPPRRPTSASGRRRPRGRSGSSAPWSGRPR